MPPLACITGLEPSFYNSFDLDEVSNSWAPSKSSSLYQVDAWGAPYFFVNENGNMGVKPHGKATKKEEEIDLMAVLEKAMDWVPWAMPGPLILRFPDILRHRLKTLQSAFDNGIRVHSYERKFQGVYPVKCNQDRFVVENIVEQGRPYGFGLEAGSKPELLIAMTYLCKGSRDALLICNGYKDSEYVGLALTARQLGLNCVIVLEQVAELDLVIRMSSLLCIQPVIGIRAKLNTSHGGHFGETSGENGKFGLTSIEILSVIYKLRHVGMLDCLQLLHFHIGSQIPSLSVLNDGVTEAAHIYCELSLGGANMNYIDVGGGLGIDYDGSKSATSDMSILYTIEEYAEEVVKAVKHACMLKKVRQPILCSESGRALVSHHSVLVFNVASSQEKNCGYSTNIDLFAPLDLEGLPDNLSDLYRSLASFARVGDYENSLVYAKHLKVEAIDIFKKGRLNLTQLATINSTHDVMAGRANEITKLKQHTAIYNINLSIFKSMPDKWAIGQLFPMLPLHHLEEQPAVRAILSDLTCDSDGKVSSFIGSGEGQKQSYLHVHELKGGDEPYYMGMFLGGAYQEALGGIHNMFGKPTVIHVEQRESGDASFKISGVIEGESAADVLRSMQHDPLAMFQVLRNKVASETQKGLDGMDDVAQIVDSLACAFNSLPYLKSMRCSDKNSRTCHVGIANGETIMMDSHSVEQPYYCFT